jgi:hypothetical protein
MVEKRDEILGQVRMAISAKPRSVTAARGQIIGNATESGREKRTQEQKRKRIVHQARNEDYGWAGPPDVIWAAISARIADATNRLAIKPALSLIQGDGGKTWSACQVVR